MTNDKQLAKQLIRNGLRVLLTGKCNFSCFFCHNEGLSPERSYDTAVDINSIVNFIEFGVRDLTLSGGEPLLVFNKVVTILKELINKISISILKELKITIVTNARLLSEETINTLLDFQSKFLEIRLNVSIHSPDPEIYNSVTRTTNQHALVLQNVKNAISSGLEVRFNFVLLRDFNSSPDSIKEIIAFSSSFAVKRIKIIEFLVTDMNREFYSSFARLDPVMYNNRFMASIIEKRSKRKTSYTFSQMDLTIDFVRCTCALGCIDCLATRELEIGPGNTVIGCIAKEPQVYPHDSKPLEIATMAAHQLNNMVKIYGNYSPSLVAEPKSFAGKGIFKVVPDETSSNLINKAKIVTFKKFTETNLMHRAGLLTQQEYSFQLVESKEETHSRIICFQERTVKTDTIAWQEIIYLDPIYDFSRTKATVNRKKIRAMGYIPVSNSAISENTILLSNRNEEELPVFLRYRKDSISGNIDIFLEVLRVTDAPWPKNEPLLTATQIAKRISLKIQSLQTASELASERLEALTLKYASTSNSSNDNLKQIYPTIYNALLVYYSLPRDRLINTTDEEVFITALKQAQLSIKKEPQSKNVLVLSILQDAMVLERFNFQKIVLSDKTNNSDLSILKHITDNCLSTSIKDFNFRETCFLALPGWYLLADYVKAIDSSLSIPEKPDFENQLSNTD